MKEYTTLKEYLKLDAKGLADTVLHCLECGKDHMIPIKKMIVGPGLCNELVKTAKDILGRAPHKTILIYDIALENIVLQAMKSAQAQMNFIPMPLGEIGEWLDSTDILGDKAAKQIMDLGADLIVGAGSGVIADLTKWAATKAKLPFILYGTAASMNAHASITATMTIAGVKSSVWLDSASAVLMDTDVIAHAPKSMRLSGLGDLTARSICNADWMLGKIIRKKDFCPVPYQLTAAGEKQYIKLAAGIGNGDAKATSVLSEASLVSAISMTMMAGETSPSSGAEHVISHFWDLQVDLEGAPKNLHGIQVGLGTLISFSIWEFMREVDIDRIDPEKILSTRRTLDSLFSENESRFKDKAPLFNEATKSKWIADESFVSYLEDIKNGWKEMWKSLDPYIGDVKEIRSALMQSGFDLSLKAIGRSETQALDAINFGSRYRSRYTILDLASELAILPDASSEILRRSGLV